MARLIQAGETPDPQFRSRVRVLIAEVVLALIALHENGLAYGDLCPDSVAYDPIKGCAKLLARPFLKYISESPSSVAVGSSAEYLSPELLQCERPQPQPDTANDLWCLGLLVHEMLTGTLPSKERLACSRAVAVAETLSGCKASAVDLEKLQNPSEVDFITRLLHPDPRQRLGACAQQGGMAALVDHPFFDGTDFVALCHSC